MTVLRQAFFLPLLLGVFFLSLYLVTGSSDLKHNDDTNLRYQTTQALVDHHRIWIAQPVAMDTRIARGRGGHWYAFYAPGQAVFMIPFYLAGEAIAHLFSLPVELTTHFAARSLDLVLGALLAVVFFLMALSIGYSRRVAAVLTLVFGVATVAWPDAQSALEQTQVNLLLLLAVLAIWGFVNRAHRLRKFLLLAATAIGIAIFTRYDAAIYVIPLALYPLWVRWRAGEARQIAGDALAFGAALFPWLILVALWNYLRFGSVVQTGLHERTFGEPPLQGLANLILSPGKGLLWYLPLVFVLPWAIRAFYRRAPSLAVFFAALCGLTLLFYANVLYWHGDPAWGPRYLYTIVPYLILPLGEILMSWSRRTSALRLFALALVGLSLILEVSAVSVNEWRFWYRLEAWEQGTVQPFHWGASHYHYYWTVRQSPILVQPDNLYQVIRLNAFGARRYSLTAHPGPATVSNPADNYPINTLSFWWADTRHPLLGPRARAGIALGLAGAAAVSLLLIMITISRGPRETNAARVVSIDTSIGQRIGS